MISILGELEQDHRNMAALLRALEYQVTVFRDGRRPDYDVIEAVMEYFLDYPDQVHHPKEDVLARHLLETGDEAARALAGLPEQHAELGRLTRRFAEVVRNVLNEAELERDRFVHAAEDFIEAQRHHMEMENQHFFPLARQKLSLDELTEAALDTLDREDPLFGHPALPRFEGLRRAILASEEVRGAE